MFPEIKGQQVRLCCASLAPSEPTWVRQAEGDGHKSSRFSICSKSVCVPRSRQRLILDRDQTRLCAAFSKIQKCFLMGELCFWA